MFLTTPGNKNTHNLAALCLTIFSKLDSVPHVILYHTVYFYNVILKNGGLQSRKSAGFPENQQFYFIGQYCPTSTQQGKGFYMYLYVAVY